jgi:hypothetical protein
MRVASFVQSIQFSLCSRLQNSGNTTATRRGLSSHAPPRAHVFCGMSAGACQRVEGGFLSSKPRGPTHALAGSPFVPSRPRNVSAKARWIFPAPCQVVHASQVPSGHSEGRIKDSTERSLPLAVRVEQNLPARLF